MRVESEFDVVVVGSGPTAVAALTGLAKRGSVAVVTGAIPSREKGAHLHPKIRTVSLERAEAAGVAERVSAAAGTFRPLFSTASVGGLANYWGQQFVQWGERDPWPRDAFSDYAEYRRACDRIEGLFAMTGGEEVRSDAFGAGIELSRPRLLTGSASDRRSGLHAMARAFHGAAAAADAEIYAERVRTIAPSGARWSVMLEDGRRLVAGRILLASGILGTGQILRRSYPDIVTLRFRDHTPWMVFTAGASKHYRSLYGEERPFNALTARHDTHEGCRLFASFYNMRGADLNLILASTIGHSHSLLRGIPAPPGAGMVTPIQVWTPDTYGTVEVRGSEGQVTYSVGPKRDEAIDYAFEAFKSRIVDAGIRIVKTSRTRPADGFHYHNLRLEDRAGVVSGVSGFLEKRTGGSVTCIDASTMHHIACQPHTLTVMARALSGAADTGSR